MEQASLDLSVVKKEPGLDVMCPSDSGIFENMMSDEFHDSSFHSVHHASEEVPVDWLSIFDEVPSCGDQTIGGYSGLAEYTNASLHYSSVTKPACLGLSNGLGMDSMVSFPEECSNESMYCSTPRSPEFEHKPLTPDSDSHAENFDVKQGLFPRQSLYDLTGTLGHLEKSLLEKGEEGCTTKCETDMDRESAAGDGGHISRLPIQSEYATLRSCRKYSYDSGSHSPKSAPTTPPRVPEDSEMSGLSGGEATSPANQNPQERQSFFLTEEERRTLMTEGLPVPTGLPLTKLEERSLKKVRRKIKNKISAQESRRKKKEYMETLEKRVESCTSENQDLRKKVDNLENSNRSLISQLQKLQSLLTAKVRPVNTRTTQTGTCLMVVVLCFAVFLGSWSPLSSAGLKFSSPGPVDLTSKTTVDYSTPSVRSRVLMSVVEEMESEDFDSGPMGDVLQAPAPATPAAALMTADNGTNSVVAREMVAKENKKNDTRIVSSTA